MTTRTRFYRDWELKQALRELEERKIRPKPPWADDPIAQSIEWRGTAAFGADGIANPKGAVVRLGTVTAARIEFRPPSTRRWHLAMLFLSVAGYVLVFIATGSFTTALLAPFIGLLLSVVAELYTRSIADWLYFDRQLGIYWRGRTVPAPLAGAASTGKAGRLSDVYALQLVSTRRYVGNPQVGVDGSGYKEFPTHELNLVLKDATRLSIVCDDDYGRLDRGAKVLADFLQRPLWKPFHD
ncbi:MAG TPA: hypothetical protein VJV75_06050 [Candidatus Polarisedimenticolia bacterium]|nr:hypothetical protein [Candidatus Polarisedimenticolia bacterium]